MAFLLNDVRYSRTMTSHSYGCFLTDKPTLRKHEKANYENKLGRASNNQLEQYVFN